MLKNFQTGRRISVENVEKKNLSTLVYVIVITVCVFLFATLFPPFTALILLRFYNHIYGQIHWSDIQPLLLLINIFTTDMNAYSIK
jgi:hypothetical protein